MPIVTGVLLVGIGIYELWSNWDLIQAFLSCKKCSLSCNWPSCPRTGSMGDKR